MQSFKQLSLKFHALFAIFGKVKTQLSSQIWHQKLDRTPLGSIASIAAQTICSIRPRIAPDLTAK